VPAEQLRLGDLDARPAPPGWLLVAEHGRAAREVLLEVVRAHRSPDPLAPLTVVVPSPLAGLALRRFVGRELGFANVHFMALAGLAEVVAAPRIGIDGRRPLTEALRLEAVHRALTDLPGPFAAAADHPATVEALAETFDELRGLDAETLAHVRGQGERGAAVVALYQRFCELTVGCYDVDDVMELAAETVLAADVHGDDEVGPVVLFLPRSLRPSELALLHALASRGRLTAVLGRTGDLDVDALFVDELAALLLGGDDPRLDAPATAVAAGERIVSVPDPEDEVRVVARELVALARDGQWLGRVAILFRTPEPYARLVPEVLDACGIPWTGSRPRRVADAAAPRVLLALLELAGTELARDDVVAWLASGPIIDPATGHRINAARWDVLSRQAGVVRGAEQWDQRLGRYADALDQELAELGRDPDVSPGQLRRLERDRDDATALRSFLTELGDALAPPETPSWAAFATWARRLLIGYVGDAGRRSRWPDDEVDAADRLEAALDELGALDVMGGTVDVGRFRRAIAAELDARIGREGRFGEGVLVGQLLQAYAGDFDRVYIIGAAEGSLPPRGREDPVLPDRDRRGIAGLEQHGRRRVEERRDFLAALAAGEERVLTFPRADVRAQRKRLPSQWVLESARALGAGGITAEALRDHTTEPWLETVQSFDALVLHGAPASATEYRLQSLRAAADAGRVLGEHPLATGVLARSFLAADARASTRATAFDGCIGPSPALVPGAAHPTSPTSLEGWAACPFSYFLGRVLRLHDVPRPEATETISALDEGSLVHAILEEFVRAAPTPATPGERWTAADRALMHDIAARHCDAAEARGITGRRVQWILARRRITQTARHFLDVDERVRATLGVLPRPDGLERPFGFDGEPPVEMARPDGASVYFRGRIDRIDRSPDGRRTVVFDYKTGRSRLDLGDDPVSGGRALQLPVYALAAQAHDGTAEAIGAYWYTRADEDDALLPVSLDDAAQRFTEVVSTIVDGIGSGCFPAHPGEPIWDHVHRRDGWEACKYCAFDRLCAVDRGAAWDRIAGDAAVAPLRELLDWEPER
jgi:ATP-dependent helicase/nuclease subunit B